MYNTYLAAVSTETNEEASQEEASKNTSEKASKKSSKKKASEDIQPNKRRKTSELKYITILQCYQHAETPKVKSQKEPSCVSPVNKVITIITQDT